MEINLGALHVGRIHKSSQSKPALKQQPYNNFNKIDGSHSWQQQMPEACVMYPVRELRQGEVVYFNFELAKEMGLIHKKHPRKLNAELKKKILDTFSIRIINEYDQKNNVRFHPNLIKKNKYMATRYLQLQHADKTGKTSGDGRCVWNGEIKHKGVTWDISSRGTGVTSLSPGSVEAGEPLKTGNLDHGYGCGLAEIDELLGSAINSEIFHHRGIITERMLAIIDFGDGFGIGVRAAPNLFRPAHMFCYLKQGQLDSLKKSVDYFIEREISNGHKDLKLRGKNKYKSFLDYIVEQFSDFTAVLDREYIFAWLDWDGDNVLANGGIIDYGSIRQFGLRHDQYRYDDVQRYSTNLNEQKIKAREIVQVFCQAVEYIEKGEKPRLEECANHPMLQKFNESLENKILQHFVFQLGIDFTAIKKPSHHKAAAELFEYYLSLESYKTVRKLRPVGDGVNRPAILNMRRGLTYLAQCFIDHQAPTAKMLFNKVLSDEARGKDRKMSYGLKKKLDKFIHQYFALFDKLNLKDEELKDFNSNCRQRNPVDRLTGDGLINIVHKIMNIKKHGKATADLIQDMIDTVVQDQSPVEIIDLEKTRHPERLKRISNDMRTIIDGYSESI